MLQTCPRTCPKTSSRTWPKTCPKAYSRTCPKTCPKACSKTCHLGQNLDLGPLALGCPMLQKACEKNCTDLATWLQIWIWANWACDGQCQHEAEGFQVFKKHQILHRALCCWPAKGPKAGFWHFPIFHTKATEPTPKLVRTFSDMPWASPVVTEKTFGLHVDVKTMTWEGDGPCQH